MPLLHAGDGDVASFRLQGKGLPACLADLTRCGGDGKQLLRGVKPRAEVPEVPDVGADQLGGVVGGGQHLLVQLIEQRVLRGCVSRRTDQEHRGRDGDAGERGQPGPQ